MNFLSHLYLSGNSDTILIGNFIGDFVKGKQMENYPEAISQGIRLHREIDYFTDNHPIVSKSKDKLRENHGHYAGVVVDIFYDHFLAANWHLYCKDPLANFVQKVYAKLVDNREIFPEKANEVLTFMIKDNWLTGYAQLDGIDRACRGMAMRTKFNSNMENAIFSLREHYTDFEKEFNLFFPLLKAHCQHYLKHELRRTN